MHNLATRRHYRERFLAEREERLRLVKEAGGAAPEHLAALTHVGRGAENSEGGTHYQQCGGGRRVIRKRIV